MNNYKIFYEIYLELSVSFLTQFIILRGNLDIFLHNFGDTFRDY